MANSDDLALSLDRAAKEIAAATALMVTAGAGMGVDSGLPDFRGTEGFWNSYPAYREMGLNFEDLANPYWFENDPRLAWGFYGHRLNLYRSTKPHRGFEILRRWAEQKPLGGFVYTSNVDGQFQRAEWDPLRIVECHGSIEYQQCTGPCGVGITPVDAEPIVVESDTFRAKPPLPTCPTCELLARPNILMFDDWAWDSTRTSDQQSRLHGWLESIDMDENAKLVVVECGAGLGVPTVRMFGERISQRYDARLIRINVRESMVPPGEISISDGALAALRAIDARIEPK